MNTKNEDFVAEIVDLLQILKSLKKFVGHVQHLWFDECLEQIQYFLLYLVLNPNLFKKVVLVE
jgi:hypothetical protein